MSAFGGLDAIFNPGTAYLREELERQRIEADIPGTSAGGGRDSVDLERGVVRIVSRVGRGGDDGPQDAPYDGPQDAPYDGPQDAPYDGPQDAPYDGPQDARYDEPQDARGV